MKLSFKNLGLAWKLLVSSVLFLLPTGVLLGFFLVQVNSDIRFSTLELEGNQIQAPLESLLADLGSWDLARLRNDQKGMASLQDAIQMNLAEFSGLEGLFFSDLRLGQYGGHLSRDLTARWDVLKSSKNTADIGAFRQDLLGLIGYVGNTSNLILDPDLDSYYTMDLTLLALPQALVRLDSIQALCIQALEGETLALDDRVHFAVAAAQLGESDLARIETSTRTALKEDANFSGESPLVQKNLTEGLKAYGVPTQKLVDFLMALGSGAPLTDRAYALNLCGIARKANADYWIAARAALDDMLLTRVQSYERIRVLGISLTALALILAGMLVFLIARGIGTSMNKALDFSASLSRGELTAVNHLNQTDEIGRIVASMDQFRKNLEHIMRNEIRSTAQVISQSIVNLSSTSQEISSSSNQQAAAVKEIVATMEDSDHLSKGIAEKIGHVAEHAQETRSRVNDGVGLITTNQAAMEEIRASNDRTQDEIRILSQKIESIDSIVNLISNIASQTKIIAFNAELEASSAGAAGKNFEVVATEIRRLADKSGASTVEIRDIISEIQRAAHGLMASSQDGTRTVSRGISMSAELETLFREILESSDHSAGSAGQITVLISQQVQAFEQILQTLRQIAQGTDNFVSSTKATRQSAEELRRMAQELEGILGKFQLEESASS